MCLTGELTGCFIHDAIQYDKRSSIKINRSLPDFTIDFTSPLVTHFIEQINQRKPKRVVICSFSARQSPVTEFLNCQRNETPCSFLAFEVFAKELPYFLKNHGYHEPEEVLLDKYLLVDSAGIEYQGYLNRPTSLPNFEGTWDAMTHYFAVKQGSLPQSRPAFAQDVASTKLLNRRAWGDEYKLLLFYFQTQRHASMFLHKGTTDTVHRISYDDRLEILGCIEAQFTRNLELLPVRYTFEQFLYNAGHRTEAIIKGCVSTIVPQPVLSDPTVQERPSGTGAICYNWPQLHVALFNRYHETICNSGWLQRSEIPTLEDEIFRIILGLHGEFLSQSSPRVPMSGQALIDARMLADADDKFTTVQLGKYFAMLMKRTPSIRTMISTIYNWFLDDAIIINERSFNNFLRARRSPDYNNGMPKAERFNLCQTQINDFLTERGLNAAQAAFVSLNACRAGIVTLFYRAF